MRRALTLLVLLFVPIVSFAEVRVTEIMYDVPGTDSGREWIEIQNIGTKTASLESLVFFENDTKHALTPYQGGEILGPNGVVVIVADPEKFFVDYPQYSGMMADSSWSSFSNEGETLEIHDTEGEILDRVVYSSVLGAAGDGQSLQRKGEIFSAGDPTPGVVSGSGVSQSGSTETNASSDNAIATQSSGPSEQQSQSTVYTTPAPSKKQVNAGGDRTIFTNIPHEFTGSVSGVSAGSLPYVQYRWNFGNGEEVTEKSVKYQYMRPGQYVVVLSALTGGDTLQDRITVTVISADIRIVAADDEGIEFSNVTKKDINLSGWLVRVGTKIFVVPPDTWLLSGKSLFLETRITGLVGAGIESTELLYPKGDVATVFSQPIIIETSLVEDLHSPKVSSDTIGQTEVHIVPSPTELIKEDEISHEEATSSTQTASALVSARASGGGMFMISLLGLLGLVGVSSATLILMRRERELGYETSALRPKKDDKTNDADSYTILE